LPNLPAIALVATPGRRKAAIEMAQEAERRGFTGIYVPSFLDGMGFCEALALTTNEIRIGTAIANIYTRHPSEYAATAALIHELSDGRFVFGVGLSHGPVHESLKVMPGKPLTDIRRFVEALPGSRTTGGTGAGGPGAMPPVVLATLRTRMVQLASEIAQGVIWANGARSHMPNSLEHLTPEQRTGDDFFIGNMIPTVVSDDPGHAGARALLRRMLTGYVRLPNYRNYWKEAGYEEEMHAIESAITAGEDDRLPALMTDRWLADVTLFGTAAEVRDGVEAWRGAGVKTPILVPSSTSGGQIKAVEELFAAFA
jgi:alkanesulfonate monooxygenase SsuD/methylene tetrahydromethanopterin reductase-like flavin-dependent oxidoreductase (luciferase family)